MEHSGIDAATSKKSLAGTNTIGGRNESFEAVILRVGSNATQSVFINSAINQY